jgi:hypothetical protein
MVYWCLVRQMHNRLTDLRNILQPLGPLLSQNAAAFATTDRRALLETQKYLARGAIARAAPASTLQDTMRAQALAAAKLALPRLRFPDRRPRVWGQRSKKRSRARRPTTRSCRTGSSRMFPTTIA